MQRQLQAETRNIKVLGFGVPYIRDLTVFSYNPGGDWEIVAGKDELQSLVLSHRYMFMYPEMPTITHFAQSLLILMPQISIFA